MACNCTYIGFPQPFGPSEISEPALSEYFSECGMMTSKRYHRYFGSDLATSGWIATWDLITPKSMRFLYIARADLIPGLTQIIFEASDDNFATTDFSIIYNFFGEGAVTLTGPREEDFFSCFDETDAFRYWRIRISMVPDGQISFSKIYFGDLFYLGQEPKTRLSEQRIIRNNRGYYSTGGCFNRSRQQRPSYSYELEYTGITNEVSFEFMRKVEFDHNRYVLLINESYPELLNEHNVLHGKITDIEVSRESDDGNDISFTFNEMIG
jgi:hypothetical protein